MTSGHSENTGSEYFLGLPPNTPAYNENRKGQSPLAVEPTHLALKKKNLYFEIIRDL